MPHIDIVNNLLLLYRNSVEPQQFKQLEQLSLYENCVFLAGQLYDWYQTDTFVNKIQNFCISRILTSQLPPQEIHRKEHAGTHLSASEFSALTAMTEMWSNAYLINLTSSKHVSVNGMLQIRLPCQYSSTFWGTDAERAMANIQDVPNKCTNPGHLLAWESIFCMAASNIFQHNHSHFFLMHKSMYQFKCTMNTGHSRIASPQHGTCCVSPSSAQNLVEAPRFFENWY